MFVWEFCDENWRSYKLQYSHVLRYQFRFMISIFDILKGPTLNFIYFFKTFQNVSTCCHGWETFNRLMFAVSEKIDIFGVLFCLSCIKIRYRKNFPWSSVFTESLFSRDLKRYQGNQWILSILHVPEKQILIQV